MQRLLCGMLLCIVVLTGCQSAPKNTTTPAGPAHNVPPAVYPGPQSENPAAVAQPYPAPKNNTASSAPYPPPSTSSGSVPLTNQYAPAPGDEKLTRGNAFVEIKDSGLIVTESEPKQVKLHLKGTLPNPCYHLRVNPSQPDDQKKIQVDVYSVTDPDKICTDVLQEFDVEIPLGSFSGGHFSIYINGELLGEFDA
jgi:hypothetical protein